MAALAQVTLPSTLHVACLCAAWCRLCDSYGPVFQQAVASLQTPQQALHAHWIDIEDEADLVGELDVETFPMLVIADHRQVRFAGPLTPQPETLLRILRAALDAAASGHDAPKPAPEVEAFSQRLRQRAGDQPAPGLSSDRPAARPTTSSS